MKKSMSLLLSFSFLFLLFAVTAAAEEAPSAELLAKGNELFNKKEGLGIKYACIMCHKQDKAVKLAKIQKAGDKLPSVINGYIVKKSKGKAIPADGEQMKALMAYIKYEHAK